ncbi:hypothetical protein [Photobacterium lutimaris]|uniref:Uncharacterized protein n=1 Tax=Photobacterium lutimaris TaxID=388278 RepID=A0A2T3J1K0_9GAMM|nr:hypothetical protein [Photobacterium lutimaris]PSU34958.1 hypothetical protein C9I99_07770 [Photobacterium lutimaris]TDR77312.1 hypothetical protein DFP78_102329 [Photobacterium lutimaris]
MSRVCRFAIAVCVFVLLPIPVNASAVDVELHYYSKASHLVNSGRYLQASQHWHRLTIVFLSSEAKLGRKTMWQYAGLSAALAAISADKANEAVAYQYWADSTRYLMTGGTNWQQMKKKLHRRYEHANTLLSTQLQVVDLAASIDSEWASELAVLQSWDETLSLFSFESPKLGLADSQERAAYYQPVDIQPKAIPAYLPPQGGKKLSGLNTSYSREQHILPTGEQALAPTKNTPPIPQKIQPLSESVPVDISGKVIVTPFEEIEYKEQELKLMAMPDKQIINKQLDAEVEPITIPSGHFEQPEKHIVAPLQRRSFAPVSQ